MKKINIIRSESWLLDDIENINNILNSTIEEFVNTDDKIINIEVNTDLNGLSRFWIYIMFNETH